MPKVSDLTADTAPTKDDLVYTVNNPSGTPVSRKVTVDNFFKVIADLTADTSPTTDDVIATVNDPSGTPAAKKVAIANLWSIIPLSAASVDTDEIRNAATFGDLTTPGPSVTMTHVGTTAIVFMSADMYKVANQTTMYIDVDVSGSNTIAPSTSTGIPQWPASTNADFAMCGIRVFTGLTPGTTTFKLQYRADTNNNGHYRLRRLVVFAP